MSGNELVRLGMVLAKAEQDGVVVVRAKGDYPEKPVLIPVQVVPIVRVLIFTGARLGEILTLCWEYVDDERGVLALPESKTGAKVIHLNAPAMAVLADLPRLSGNPYVFPGMRKGQHFVGIHNPWHALRQAAGIPDVRLHDLRHSFASMGVAGGMGLPIIGRLLGHTRAETTHRYAHLSDDPLKAAAESIGQDILAAMLGELPSRDNLRELATVRAKHKGSH